MPIPAIILAALEGAIGAAGSIAGTKATNASINTARTNIGNATSGGIDILTQLLNQSQNELAPFKAAGPSALQQMSNLTFRGGKAAGVAAPTIPGQPAQGAPPAAPYDFSKVIQMAKNGGATNPLAGLSEGELAALGIRDNAPVQFGPGPGSVSGDIAGGIGSIFNHNSSKTAATLGVNELSNWTWNKLKPAMQAGKIGKAEGQQIFNTWWQQWIQSMRDAGVSPKIIESSITDQSRYIVNDFNNFLASLPDAAPVAA